MLAPDWRGFGRSAAPGVDSYWFPDYVADLDALLDRISPDAPVDLVGHSMGGNVVMSYAGTCGRSASAGWSTWKASACRPRSRSRRRPGWRNGWTS